MTKHGDYGRGGDNMGIFTLNALITTHYSISSLLHSQFNTLNPFPTSCRASLESITNPYFPILKPQFTRIGYTPQSLITRNTKALFKGKSLGDLVLSGESKVLPRYMQNRFEGYKGLLHIDSYRGAESQAYTYKSLFMRVYALSASNNTRGTAGVSGVMIKV